MTPTTLGRIRWLVPLIAASGAATVMIASAPASPGAASPAASVPADGAVRDVDGCVACHGDPGLRVTHPRLFEYFRKWELSTHASAGVSCVDCHGGDATATDRETAHGTADMRSAVAFRRVPETCGSCHEAIYETFVTSHHYELLMEGQAAGTGPNCVTCHGSLDAMALTVSTVDGVCGHCHAQDPDIGRRAEALIRDLEVISAYGRFVRLRGSPETVEASNRTLEPVFRNLVAEWHTFDLDAIESRTESLLELSQIYRDRVRMERRAERESAASSSGAAE